MSGPDSTKMQGSTAAGQRGFPDKLDLHLENSPLGVVGWDKDFRLSQWSPRAEQVFGWKAEELLGKSFGEWRFVYEGDRGAVDTIAEDLMSGRVRSNVSRNRNYRKDGRLIECEWYNSALFDEAGDLVSILSLVQDVTDREQAKRDVEERDRKLQKLNTALEERVRERTAELRESQQRYIAVVQTQTEMICRFRPDTTLTFVNAAYCRLLGRSEEALLGKSFLPFLPEQDREALRIQLESLAADPRPMEVEHRAVRSDGTVAYHLWVNHPVFDDSGRLVEFQSIGRDVTEKKDAEQRLKLVESAINQVKESVVITDADLDAPGPRIVYVNPAFEQITGYSAAEVIGRSPRILQGPKTDRVTLDRLKRVLRACGAFVGETVNYRKDRSEYVVEWGITPVLDDSGQPVNFVSIQRDLTERRAAEEQARRHREELAHVSRLSTMGEMASGLAHEINQPLAAITNYLQGARRRLRSGTIDQQQLDGAIERAAGQANRASEIIRRLRQFVAKRATERQEASVNELVANVLELAMPEARQHSVRLRTELAETLPGVVVDGIQIEQVLLNLIKNAIEAVAVMPANRRVVVVRSGAQPGGGVLVRVCDRGPGLTREQLDHVFDPFFTTKDGGMGMGLAISQSIVEAHGGRLWAESTQGDGAVFGVALPPGNANPRPGLG